MRWEVPAATVAREGREDPAAAGPAGGIVGSAWN